jgi:cytochrome P450
VLPPLFENPPKDFLLTLEQGLLEHGDIFRLKFGYADSYVVSHPDLAYEILVKQKNNFSKLGDEAGLARVLGKGILTNADYDSWFAHRRVLQPAFHKEAVANWTKAIRDAGERCLQRWWDLPENSIVDISEEMLKVTQELLYEIIFSLSPHEAKMYPINLPLTLATRKNSIVREAKETVDKSIYTLIAKRREEKALGKMFEDLLELLLTTQDADTGATMTDKEIRDELATVFAAGHDTTSYALTWTLYLLSQHPEVLQLLQQEIDEGEKLEYTIATFKESLRLFPTIPSIPRIALGDVRLAGFDIPAKARLFISIYLVHRHPDFWQDANVFRPERFLATSQPKAYIPFGLGERYCLGKNLAMLQGQILLSMLVKNFDYTLVDKTIQPKVTVSLYPKDGMKMMVILKNNSSFSKAISDMNL